MYLLDTNHCSLAILGNQNVLNRLTEIENSLVSTCVIVQGELVDMAERSQRREHNLALIHRFIQSIYIYNIDEFTATIYGQLKAALFNQFAPKEKTKLMTNSSKSPSTAKNQNALLVKLRYTPTTHPRN